MKWPSEMLQILPYFWNIKTYIVFFSFRATVFPPNECTALALWLGQSLGKFVFQKYGKFWSILVGHFIKHKALISEEYVGENH